MTDAFTVTSMTKRGLSVTITLAVPGAPDFAVILTPRDGKPAWTETRHLSIRYAGDQLSAGCEEAMRLVAGSLRDTTFDAVASKLPEARGPDSATRGPGDQPGSDKSHEVVTVDEWGNRDRWRTFIFRREFQRNASSMLQLSGRRVVTISHGESECQYATPQIDGRTMSIYNYPWVRPLESAWEMRPGGSPARPGHPVLPAYITTDLRDTDVITGGTPKLERVLDWLADLTERDDLVVVASTCVPHVIGDDMEGAVSRWRGKGRAVYDDVFAKTGSDTVGDLLTSSLRSVARPGRAGARTLDIAGLGTGRAAHEMIFLLESAGIKVNCSLIPAVDLEAARRWRRAAVQVLVPNPYYTRLYEKAFLPLKMKTVMPPAPYGVSATREWCLEVAGACGRAAAMRKVWHDAEMRLAPAFERLRNESSRCRLGFVVSPVEYAAICDPEQTAGVPLLDVAVELGFGIDLLVYVPGKQREGLAVKPSHAKATALHHFGDKDELDSLLRSAPCAAVYSDLYCDDRVVGAGKIPFSLQFFEPGLPGALRTGERLSGACNTAFYRKYRDHVREP